jgi:uncharacterized protein YfaA (DUF2138 family)
MSRRRKLVLAAVVLLLLAGGVLAVRRSGAVVLAAAAIALDLARPDALVETASLADLPRDLLAVPTFRDVLTEDFVTYYETTEGRLSLAGTLRRLAYEHDLDLGDRVIRMVLDQPAEVALYKGADGRLGHSLLVVNRTGLTRILEMAAKVALKDAQLKRVEGDLEVDGAAVPVYALAYAHRRVLLFAGHGDRLVILSDAAMLTDRRGRLRSAGRAVVAGLLSGRAEARGIFRAHWALEPGERRHTLVVSARYLSFGYARFFPGVRALRFDFARDGWATRALFEPAALPERALATRALWSLAPAGAGACVAMPVQWREAAALAGAVGLDAARVQPVVDALDGPAAVCWYPKSRLSTPLFLVSASRPLDPAEAAVLERIFAAAIGAPESARTDTALVLRRAAPKAGVAALARYHLAIAFSPDDRLVDDVLAVAARRYPSLADSLPEDATVLAVLAPRALGTLAEAEAFAALPAGQEPVFRNAASAHLVPRLAALKRHPAYALVLPAGSAPAADSWLEVEWRSLGRP